MAASRKRKEIIRDWRIAKKYEKALDAIAADGSRCEKRICMLSKISKDEAYQNKLLSTDVDCLKSLKIGINTSVLRRAGYSNLWQLQDVSRDSLMNCRGIGSVGADRIIGGVDALSRQLFKDSKVNLSIKAIVSNSNRLGREIYYWKLSNSVWRDAIMLSRNNEIAFRAYKSKVSRVLNIIKWAFIDKKNKQKVLEECDVAYRKMVDYRAKISEYINNLRVNSDLMQGDSFIDDYNKDPKSYLEAVASVSKGRYEASFGDEVDEGRAKNMKAGLKELGAQIEIDERKKMPLAFSPSLFRGDTSMLTQLQRRALDSMARGENVFLTGGAGTGKSFVLRKFLEMRNQGRNIVACAPTGVAALNLEWGVTIHKAFRVPVGEIADYRHLSKSLYGPKDYVKNADVIVIDEISMCPIDVFDFIMEQLHKIEKERKKRFQIIVCGDFFQLPPVMDSKKAELLKKIYPDMTSGFCFEAKNWPYLGFSVYNLTEVIRQKDAQLIEMLNKARIGDSSCLSYFNEKVVGEEYDASGDIVLSGRNSVADKINNERLSLIDAPPRTYTISIEGDVPLSRITFVEELTLKVGARVMALMNDTLNYEYVNGSIGTVMALFEDHVTVKWDSGFSSEVYGVEVELKEPDYRNGKFEADIKGVYSQIPLKLCYAITIHKSQGQSIDKCVIYPNSFEKGQLYVAMSRCTNPEHLHFASPIKESDLRVSRAVIDFYNSL